MKKILSIVLCLALVLSLAAVVSADNTTAGLVTSADKLADGQQIVIACMDKGTAMGPLNGQICSSVDATISDDKATLTLNDSICIVTLEAHASEANTYALKVDGGYLVCTSNKKLAVQETPEISKYWTIDVAANGIANIVSVNVAGAAMQYNAGSPRFTTYTSAQTAVAIYAVGVAGSAPASNPTDPVEIVNAAYALAEGAKLPYTSTLTGTVTEVEGLTSWGAITLTITVEGCTDKPIVCYGMSGEGASELAVGDIVTVTGTLMNYKGIIEFASGCSLDSYVKGSTTEPEVPETNDPAADSTLTVAEAIALGASKEHNTYTEGKYYVTGTISEIASTKYGNMYITDSEGNSLYLYGLYSADGSVRYDAMETQPQVGDTITVYGIIGQYSDNAQMKNAWMTAHTPAATPEEPEVPENNDPAADSTLTIEEALALGASKEHNTYTEGKYYVTGTISEIASTKYGNMYITDAEGNSLYLYGLYSADGSIRYDAMETQPQVGDTITVYGIIGQYSDNAQMKNAWMTAHTPATTPEEPEVPVEPETPVEPEVPEEPEYVTKLVKVDAPAAGTAFKLGFYQVALEKQLYFAGAMDGYYYAMTEDESAAVDVYVEAVEGGYHLYFMDGETKTYLDIVPREGTDNKVNVVLTTTPTAVFTWFEDASTFVVKDLQGGDWYMGTYNTYSTISASLVSYITGENAEKVDVSQFPAHLYAEKTVPATGDSISVVIALMAVAAVGAAVIIKKKEF